MSEDFAVSLDQERHDEATKSSLAALDAGEANLEDTIRASIARAIRAEGRPDLDPVIGQWTKGYRQGLERAATIASGATS